MPSSLLTSPLRWLTTPLLPEDVLGLVDPLRSGRDLRARVEAVHPETDDAATLVLRPGRGWSGHRPGQYVRVGVEIDGVLHRRTYSLTSVPGGPLVSITVKDAGLVSGHLVRRTLPGDLLRLAPAQGDFVLADPAPERLLLLTGGSGITPAMGILRSLLAAGTGTDVVVVHSAPRRQDVIFGTELRAYARAGAVVLHERHTDTDGVLDLAELDGLVPDWRDREAYVCGPAGLLDAAEAHWAALPGRLHTERFRPVLLADPSASGGPVAFTRTGRTADADGNTPLLAVGEDAGVPMPSGCRMGICFGCVAPLRSGRVRDLRTGQVHGDEGDLVQTCVSAAAGPVELDL